MLLSRVAESVYWMNRYIERAENIARFVDVNQATVLEQTEVEHIQWEPLVATTGDQNIFKERYGAATRDNVIRFLAFDGEYANSICQCLAIARENARTIRENLSNIFWEELNKAYMMVRDANQDAVVESPYGFLDRVKLASQLLLGIAEATMSHGEAWHFARLGRLMERADKTSRILDVKYFILLPDPNSVGTSLDVVQWSALLKSASALMMYRKHHGKILPGKVAEFLLLSGTFPRSVRFTLQHAEYSMHVITGTPGGTFCNRAEQKLGQLRASFDYSLIDDIIAQGMHEFIDQFQVRLNDVGSAIHDSFFAIEQSFQQQSQDWQP